MIKIFTLFLFLLVATAICSDSKVDLLYFEMVIVKRNKGVKILKRSRKQLSKAILSAQILLVPSFQFNNDRQFPS